MELKQLHWASANGIGLMLYLYLARQIWGGNFLGHQLGCPKPFSYWMQSAFLILMTFAVINSIWGFVIIRRKNGTLFNVHIAFWMFSIAIWGAASTIDYYGYSRSHEAKCIIDVFIFERPSN